MWIFVLITVLDFLFFFAAFFMGRYSQSVPMSEKDKEIWEKAKGVFKKKDKVVFISPSKKSESKEFLEEVQSEEVL